MNCNHQNKTQLLSVDIYVSVRFDYFLRFFVFFVSHTQVKAIDNLEYTFVSIGMRQLVRL